jgi:iron complex transport system substrate-binding protein
MKRVLSILLILAVFSTFFVTTPLKAQGYIPTASIQLKINSENFIVDGFDMKFIPGDYSKPVIINGVPYVPVRGVVEAVGGTVGWVSKERKVIISLNDKSLNLYINNPVAEVNGSKVKISDNSDVEPIIVNSITLIPAEFLTKSLGGTFDMNKATNNIDITLNKQLIQVIDVTGRKVLVPKKIYKIVSLYPMSTQLLFPLKSEDKLIATPAGKVTDFNNFAKVLPDAKNLPDASDFRDPNIETILSYKPDLIITTYQTLIKKLEEAGLPVVLLNQESPQLLLKSIQFLGNILGKYEEARQSLIYFNEKLNYIKGKTGIINKKATLYIAGANILTTFGGDFYQTYLAELAGVISVSKVLLGGKVNVSAEQILLWNPEYIVLTPYCADSVNDVLSNPKLKDLKAIKEKQVFRMPSYILSFDLPAPESILGIMWLSNKIYPQIVNFNIEKEVRNFYQKIYNFDIPQEDLRLITGG